MDRRTLIRRALLLAGGAGIGAGAVEAAQHWPSAHLPLAGGYAPAADRPDYDVSGGTEVTWHVQTDELVVAFTFDDGPGPQWTSMVLDILEQYAVPATFFLVGSRLAAHGDLLKGRLDRHEVANHSWSHPDLATMNAPAVERQIARTHDTVRRITGREPTLFRPPYGHLGGSTLMAADKLGYQLVLWSHQMAEKLYVKNPPAQAKEVIDSVRPGEIILAHDVGYPERYVALSQLGAMFDGLRKRGYRFATVSELMVTGSVVETRK
jgi:peptidoglycan/xylan/chitin deacetylase (PgdA/CDA1 family)